MEKVVQWSLYRSVNDGPWRSYQLFKKEDRAFKDYLIQQGNAYKYKLKAACTDTRKEWWSNEVKLNF
ncbi:MAG: hypothetical protein HC819_21190 [Cyclobacteriaceae bacterium]|nr:hypothetical protein [Cyclobacteriaceae bacterium]